MIGAVILAHLIGDYLLQNHWMANEKTKRWWPALLHGFMYTLPFLFITQSPWALLVISGTHAVIDHYRLAKYFIWARDRLAPRGNYRSSWPVSATGASDSTPIWLSTWLMIIADNTIHMIINVAAIRWL